MARTQTIVQLNDELLAEIDARLARSGGRTSRSELIRDAIRSYLAEDRQAAVDQAIVEGYARTPPVESFGAEWSAKTLISAEPWDGPTSAGDGS